MDKNKEVIAGLIKIKDWANFALINHWMMTDGIEKMKEYADNAISLLLAMDVTPEELERFKKCRHECKIDCMLEHYEKIKAERDAMLEAQKARTCSECRHYDINAFTDMGGKCRNSRSCHYCYGCDKSFGCNAWEGREK